MATFTADAAQSTISAREVADGVTTVVGSYTFAAVPSAGDIVQMIKIPPNCMLTSLQVAGNVAGANATPLITKVGYTGQAGTASIFSAAVSFSSVQSMVSLGLNMPRQLTISDDTTVQYSLLTMKVGTVGSATSTSVLTMVASYCRKGTGTVT